MDIKILSEQYVLKEYLPSISKIDIEQLKTHSLKHFNDNFKITNNISTFLHNFYKIEYHQHLVWLSQYIIDLYKSEFNKNLIPLSENAIICSFLKKGEDLKLHNQIDPWELKTSPDVSCYFCLSEINKDLQSSIHIEYENNRFKSLYWRTKIEQRNFICLNSNLNHSITTNKSDNVLINLLLRYQII